jgi:hypothetical protein
MKLKYKYRVHHLLESYPTEEDALFEITSFLEEKGKSEEEWSDLSIKGAFSKKLPEEEVSKLLESLVLQGCLSMREGSGKRNYYKIIKKSLK